MNKKKIKNNVPRGLYAVIALGATTADDDDRRRRDYYYYYYYTKYRV